MPNKTTLIQGDCLEIMKDIENGSVDMICADSPYGTTNCAWDSIIPLEPMWKHLKRTIKPNGAIVMTASQPFTSILITSNIEMFRYEWIWEKDNHSNFLNIKKQPGKRHENVCVFYKKQPTYNPIKWVGKQSHVMAGRKNIKREYLGNSFDDVIIKKTNKKYPISIIKFEGEGRGKAVHPTQKPVALMEYLIKTYTNKGETILDFCMGSGTTGVACKNLNRNFIGIEKDLKYFEAAKNRIDNPDYRPPTKKEKQKEENKGLFPDDEIANLLTIKSH